MIDELFLIAHKVRGLPAFDIAIQMEMEDGVWWILPSVGHRAYPYWWCELAKLGYTFQSDGSVPNLVPSMPSDLQDFFEVTTKPIRETAKADRNAGQSLLAKLGLKTSTHAAVTGKLERRI